MPKGDEIALIDLPGVYSLTPKSEDEKVAVDVLTGQMPGTPRPDAIILVLNSTNLHSHLVLAARVIALGMPTLVLLNMADELRKQGGHVDVLSLARQLGTPVALVSATTGEGHRRRAEFSVLRDRQPRAAGAAGCRQHARLSRMGGARRRECKVSPSGHAGVDAAAGFSLPPPHLGTGDLCGGRDRRLSDDLRCRPAALEPAAEVSSMPPARGWALTCRTGCSAR